MNNIINKANKTLGFLLCNLKISSIPIKEKAYKAFVQPLLEYSAPVWGPYTQKGASRLEAVQRRAARFVLTPSLPPSDRSDSIIASLFTPLLNINHDFYQREIILVSN